MLDFIHAVFQVFSLTIATLIMIISLIYFKRNNAKIVLYYGILILSFVLVTAMDLVFDKLEFIDDNILMASKGALIVINSLQNIFIITSPLFVLKLLNFSRFKESMIIFIILYIINLLLFCFSVIFMPAAKFLSDYFIFISYLFMYIFLLFNMVKVIIISNNSFLKFTAIIFSILLPFIIVFDSLDINSFPFDLIGDLDLLFFNIWNIGCIVHLYKHIVNRNNYLVLNYDEYIKKIKLSKRECDVFKLLIKGLSYQKIADKLFISQVTVKTHVLNIYKKANVKNKVALFDNAMNSLKLTDFPPISVEK